ncbi:MAG TPA: hypothetical protein VN656_11540 [Stellaceae bacterium]|nr:hypothetical protein [Stellaceae bacterium]
MAPEKRHRAAKVALRAARRTAGYQRWGGIIGKYLPRASADVEAKV